MSDTTLMDAVRAARSNPALTSKAWEAICKDVVQRTRATRASVWTFSPARDAITSVCLYDDWKGGYSSGVTLQREDFRDYFKAIEDDLKVVAPHARTHPATSCFNKAYFEPLDIHSLLDFVVLVRGEPVAILCCEHCGAPREWTAADIEVLHQTSTVVAMVLKGTAAG